MTTTTETILGPPKYLPTKRLRDWQAGHDERKQELRGRIQAAYKTLRKRGYLCRANFWCCQGCAWSAIAAKREEKGLPVDDDAKVVFYHQQDNERLVEDGTVMFAWSGDGYEIAGALVAAGLVVLWDGSDNTRIEAGLHPEKDAAAR